MRRQQDGARDRNPDFCCQGVIEEFFVSTPPERVIYYGRTGKSSVLEKTAIKRHILRNPINNDIVAARFPLDDFVDFNSLGHDLLTGGFLIDAINESPRKRVFLTE